MGRPLRAFVALVACCGIVSSAFAGVLFSTALKQYQDGDYDGARKAFAELAELGQPSAQALYGQMLVKGQGGPVALGAGFGWMQAAAGNGSNESLNQLDKIKANIAKLPAVEQDAANDVLKRYRRGTLEAELVPTLADFEACPGTTATEPFEAALPGYPASARRWGSDADVLVEVRIGVDGLTREPHILAWFAETDLFNEVAVQAVLRSRFVPATRDGHPVEGSYRVRIHFRIQGGGSLYNFKAIEQASRMATAGNAEAEYLIASGAQADGPAFHRSNLDAITMMLRAAQDGYIPAQAWLAGHLLSRSGCLPSPKAGRWLEIATRGGDPVAQVTTARTLLSTSEPSVETRAEAKRLLLLVAASDSIYAARVAAAILASSPYDDVRDAPAALATMQRLKTTDYDADPLTQEAYAAAQASSGHFSEASSREERAIRLARDYRWNIAAMTERLASYRKSHAWTGDLFALPPVPPPGPPPSDLTPCDSRRHTSLCVRIFPSRKVVAAQPTG